MATDCERYEIEIGMRQHGALDAREESALEVHLAGCAGCRKFSADSGGLDEALERHAAAEVASVDWPALRERITGWQRWHRRKLWLAPLFLLQLPLSFLAATGHLPPRELLVAGPPMTVGIYLAYVWLVNRPFREVLAVARRSDDLLAGWRRELGRQRLRARIFAWANLALAFGCLAAAFADGASTRISIYAFGCAALFGGWSAYDFALRLPRLGRALAESAR